MAVQVLHNYGGAPTGEQRILPGLYDENDPALFGVGDYLVESGHAVRIKNQPPKPVDPADAYKALTNDEIKALAQSRNVELGDATKKADMIALLVAADAAAPAEDTPPGGGS